MAKAGGVFLLDTAGDGYVEGAGVFMGEGAGEALVERAGVHLSGAGMTEGAGVFFVKIPLQTESSVLDFLTT